MMHPTISSSDPKALREATRTANKFCLQFRRRGVVGIVFLGAIVWGYFDRSADIDIALFTNGKLDGDLPPQYHHLNGYEIHCWVADYYEEASSKWDMAKRWAFSEGEVHYDPDGLVSKLVAEKVRLGPEERKWLLISGITLSEWYINRLTALWVERGSILSAHSMVSQGLNHFYEMLFGLNNKLVADHKWRSYYAACLTVLPENYHEDIAKVLTVREVTEVELKRRVEVFMGMWKQMLSLVEKDVGMKFEEFKNTV
jgi:hypothetical protein